MKVDPFVLTRSTATEIAIGTRVELRSDDHASEGATRGMIGYVIERYPDGNFEIEFSNPKTGETIAQIVVRPWEIRESPLAAKSQTANARYYIVNDRPVMIIRTPNGGEDCLVYDFASGEMLPDRSYFDHVVPGSGKDVDALDEDDFSDRIDALREASARRAIDQLRTWIAAFGESTGDVTEIARALGLVGRVERGDLFVDPAPPGYTKVVIKPSRADDAIELRPRRSLLSRDACDTAFGDGRELPLVDPQTTANIAYPPIGTAKKPVSISINFSRAKSATDGGAHRILLNRSH